MRKLAQKFPLLWTFLSIFPGGAIILFFGIPNLLLLYIQLVLLSIQIFALRLSYLNTKYS